MRDEVEMSLAYFYPDEKDAHVLDNYAPHVLLVMQLRFWKVVFVGLFAYLRVPHSFRITIESIYEVQEGEDDFLKNYVNAVCA